MTQPMLTTIPALTLHGCRGVLEAAEAQARTQGTPLSIALLDAGGHLQLFLRMDGAHLGTIDVAIAKARCALQFKRATKLFADAFAAGGTALAALPGLVPFAGGVPLLAEGVVVGAIGVSGAAPEQDDAVANAGASGLKSAEGKHR